MAKLLCQLLLEGIPDVKSFTRDLASAFDKYCILVGDESTALYDDHFMSNSWNKQTPSNVLSTSYKNTGLCMSGYDEKGRVRFAFDIRLALGRGDRNNEKSRGKIMRRIVGNTVEDVIHAEIPYHMVQDGEPESDCASDRGFYFAIRALGGIPNLSSKLFDRRPEHKV